MPALWREIAWGVSNLERSTAIAYEFEVCTNVRSMHIKFTSTYVSNTKFKTLAKFGTKLVSFHAFHPWRHIWSNLLTYQPHFWCSNLEACTGVLCQIVLFVSHPLHVDNLYFGHITSILHEPHLISYTTNGDSFPLIFSTKLLTLGNEDICLRPEPSMLRVMDCCLKARCHLSEPILTYHHSTLTVFTSTSGFRSDNCVVFISRCS